MLASVWEATWARLSPVETAATPSLWASSSATRNMNLRKRISSRPGGAFNTPIWKWW
jgi:hypothetical protein